MLERILQFSISHRWLVVLLTLGAAMIGIVSLQRLPIDAVPDITPNQVQINTLYAALSPEEIEKQITLPIENALAGIPGLKQTRSLSRNAFSQVVAIFDDNVDIYFARQQVLERLTEARESLPGDADPKMGPITTGLGEVYMWTVEYQPASSFPVRDGESGWQRDGSFLTPEGERLTTDLQRAAYLRTVQDWIIRPQLKNVTGVAGVDAIGGYVKQYHVQPDPMKLVFYGLSFHDVIEALERNNASTGAGYIEHKGESYLVRAAGRIESVEQIGQIVVAQHRGTPIHIHDIASVGVGEELRTGSASENGEEVVVGTAMMLIGSNSRTVAKAVDERMKQINRSLPPGVVAKPVLDRTKLVDATIRTVRNNLFEGAILVIVVLLILLGNIRAALITAMAIPLSMLLAATGMVQTKISGNLMSLGAIDFGLIVDGSVIIVENCVRRLAHRQQELGRQLTLTERLQEVFIGCKQVRTATAFGEAIIITVYIPILFLTGIEGKMFYPMAMTVIFALMGAFVLSLTFIPAMVAICLTGRIKEKENILIRWSKQAYEPVLRLVIRLRYGVVALAVVIFAGSLWLFSTLGQEFIPQLDEQDIAMHAMRIPSTSLTQSTQMQFDVEKVISAQSEVAFVYSKTGTAEMAADPMPPSVSDTFVIFKPQDQWRSPAELDQLIRELEAQAEKNASHHDHHGHDEHGHGDHGHGPAVDLSTHKGKVIRLLQLLLAELPGNNYEFTQPIQMRFNELIAGVRSDIAVKVYGEDFDALTASASDIARILQSIPGASDVKVEQTQGLPVMNININREAIARLGLSVADVQEVIAIAIGGRQAGQVYQGDRRFDLVVRMPDELRRDLTALRNLPVPLPAYQPHGTQSHLDPLGQNSHLTTGHENSRPGFIPLGAIATLEVSEGMNQISRENGKRRVVVQLNVRGRDIGSFVAEAQRKIDQQVTLPSGQWIDWGGQFENMITARQRLSIVVPICFFLIFLLLFSTFGTLRHALIVFTSVPLALTGGIISLWLRDMPFSISAAVGFIALSGVAVLNGLVMITFINQLRKDGLPLEQAIVQGALTRLRPVLMTALVASLGFLPMALARGTGAEVQRPVATVVVGGLVTCTLLTLLVLPALYAIFDGQRKDRSTSQV